MPPKNSINDSPKKNAEEYPCGSRRFCRVSHTSNMIGHQFSGQGKKKNKQTNKNKNKKTKRKQNIPATLKAGGDDFRRC